MNLMTRPSQLFSWDFNMNKLLSSFFKSTLSVAILGSALMVGTASADAPGREEFKERIPLPPTDEVPVPEADNDEWILGAHAGVTVFALADEHTQVGPALFFDARNTSVPLNFRVGVEGTHLNVQQSRVDGRPDIGDTPDLTYVRVPTAIEYVADLCDKSTLYVGGGPDLISISGLGNDTDWGAHLGARVLNKITDNMGISLEAGYQWADLDIYGGPIDLDGAYVTTLLSFLM